MRDNPSDEWNCGFSARDESSDFSLGRFNWHMDIISKSVNATINIGRSIASKLQKGDIICLSGNLGAGKTVLAKGIASGLGVDMRSVTSPTFVLIRQYKGKIPLYHFDLYRLKQEKDMFALGYEEYFYNEGVTVVEWPDRMGYLMPREFLKVEISIKEENQREMKFLPCGKRYKNLLGSIKDRLSKGKGHEVISG